ncbi:FHS family L-fucose permease-like MFS transporter [Granulicella aggregans]|uniref:FHS family L-fucose permease-like MFS transporter n=1 Tax=Granulicella aggregans TaxID=474949 RepID=A0A7W7ZC03_9BACT|nr:L-fucose:H+ symporter permease [Granulicella aggregans]MBB5057130.1 FHS family L-fucose permease-like MFS transporter [Granulicella aggregans]
MQAAVPSTQSKSDTRNIPVFPEQIALFVLVTVLFFLWGMSNNLTDILVQQFRKSFELSPFSAQLVSTANFTGYFVMAIPAALIMRHWGYKTGMVMGLVLFGSGMVLFWPAAVSGQYIPFLIALFAVGCGASVLETAANPFMAQFGPPQTSERRLNFAQSFNPPGTILGVIIGGQFIFSGVELTSAQVAKMKAAGTYASYLHSEIMRVVPTYLALGSAVLLFALLLSRMKFPVVSSDPNAGPGSGGEDTGSFAELIHYPQLWFAVVANVFNIGAQICMWSNLIPYMKQYTPVTERSAAHYLTATLIVMSIGRFATTPLMKYVAANRILGLYALINVALMGLAVTRPGMLGAYAIVAASFFLSIMFPTIFALGLKGLGPNTKLAGSLLVMAIVGGAIFPLFLGAIARQTGSLALGYLVPLTGFAGVSLYGFFAPRPKET